MTEPVFLATTDVLLWIQSKARAATTAKEFHVARVLESLAEDIEGNIHEQPIDTERGLAEFFTMVGEANIAAGWWQDANLDLRDCVYTPHVMAGKMMLVVSEVSEAMEGHRKSKKTKTLMDDHLTERPMVEVEFADAIIRLADLAHNYRLPNGQGIDVAGAIVEKLAYNKIRPDHKLEARAADGGKSI